MSSLELPDSNQTIAKTKTRNVLKEKAFELDSFGQGFNFKLPNGKDRLNSCLGFTLTMMIFVCLSFYGCLKFLNLVTYADSAVIMSNSAHSITSADALTAEDGLMFAFAFTSYHDDSPDLTADYGELKVSLRKWGQPNHVTT